MNGAPTINFILGGIRWRLGGGSPLDGIKGEAAEGVQFVCGDAQRRHEDEDVPQGPDNGSELPGLKNHPMRGAPGHGKGFLGRLIRHQFNPHHKAALTHISHMGMSRHLTEMFL
jgi:hypothetical protein